MTRLRLPVAALALALAGALPASAQQPATAPPIAPSTGDGTMMMTVFMRHDQSKNLNEINTIIHKQGYFDQFPPAGVEVVSWYVVVGIGQIVTLRFPPEKLREINVVLENTMWGPYRTDFYPTYDFKTVYEQQRKMMQARPKPQ
ncbi:hypothetical protein [uncultured Enterovirga sp.]|uniref:hypothetical protein n=1 Tax=uncultured Enterovirga sp. TaxID=2026352 RepID=UPI0035C9475E